MELQHYLKRYAKAAVAFSGGVDSAYLLYAAKQAGCLVRAFYVKTAFQPQFELEDAKRLAQDLEIPMTVLYTDILQFPKVAQNPPERCYYCKQALFRMLWNAARASGFWVLMDGSNASDDAGDRPGMRALQELEVRSPLRECGLDKEEIRRRSREAGLFTWDKPAYACLATRVPSGTKLDLQTLQKVEQAEGLLYQLGFSDLRVRVLPDAAKLQLPAEQLERAVCLRREIVKGLAPLFGAVLLDLCPRE